MATRINMKFVLIAAVIFCTLVTLILGVWWIQRRSNVTLHLERGDGFIQTGDYRRAKQSYRHAVAEDPGNIAYLRMMEEALLQITPITANEADELYMEYIQVLTHDASHHPSDAAAHLRLLEEQYNMARTVESSVVYGQVIEYAGQMWNGVALTDPDRIKAKFYLGACKLAPMRLNAIDRPEELSEGEAELREYLAERPDDDLGWSVIVMNRIAQAERLRDEGRGNQALEAMDEVDAALAEAREHIAEGGPHLLMAELARAIMMRTLVEPEEMDLDAVRAAATRLVAEMENPEESWMVRNAVDLSMRLRWIGEMPDATSIVDRYLEAHPDAIDQHLVRARLSYALGDLDAAESHARQVLDAEPLKVSLLARQQHNMRRQAGNVLVDIEFRRWDSARTEDEAAAEEHLEQLDAWTEQLAGLVQDPESDPLIIRARGKLAYARRDFATAANLLDKLVREDIIADTEMLLMSAICVEELGNIGRAEQRIDQALAKRPDIPGFIAYKASLALRQHRYDVAEEYANRLLEVEPDSEAARDLMEEIATRRLRASGEAANEIDEALLSAQEALNVGDLDLARSLLVAALTRFPEDLRILNGLIRVEMQSGATAQAEEYLAMALELAPDNRTFISIKHVLEVDDPIESSKGYVAEVYDDEVDQVMVLLTGMWRVAISQEELARRAREQGEEEIAADAEAMVARARAEEAQYRARAEELAPDDPRLVDYLFTSALYEERWVDAEAIAERASELNLDRTQGALYRGRMHGARGDMESAVRSLREAVRQAPYSATAWRLLAAAHQTMGDFDESLDAFEHAYENNPNDLGTVVAYTRLLNRTGNQTRALLILRTAHRLAANDTELREMWLSLEQQEQLGDVEVALRERRRLYESNPNDTRNATELARLLGELTPTRTLVVDDDGEPRYTDRQWRTITSDERRAAIEGAKEDLLAEADAVLENLAAEGERGHQWHNLKAFLLRQRGAVLEGETVLREYVQTLDESSGLEQGLLMLAQYQMQVNRRGDAEETLRRALLVQNDEYRNADYMLGNLLFQMGRYGEAGAYYDRVYEVRPEQRFEMQSIECLIRTGDFDQARNRLAAMNDEFGESYMAVLMEATIVSGEIDALWRDGLAESADVKYAEQLEILSRAAAIDPTKPQPHVLRAQAMLKSYFRSGDTVILDDALRALSAADEVANDFEQTIMMRASVLHAMRNLQGAINELTRLLQARPTNDSVRRRLLAMQTEGRRGADAIETVREALELNPASTEWREQLGDLLLSVNDDPDAAVVELRRAFETEHAMAGVSEVTSRLAVKLANAHISQSPPAFGDVIALVERNPDDRRDNPMLGSFYAIALHNTGRTQDALEEMRITYRENKHFIELGMQPASNIGNWFAVLRGMFPGQDLQPLHDYVMDLTGGELDAYELRSLANMWFSLGPAGDERATELMKQGIDLCPADDAGIRLALHADLGLAHLSARRFSEAIEAFGVILAADPNNVQALNNTAYVYSEELGSPQQALPYAEKAAELRPSDWSVLDTVGWVYFRLGRYEEAESALRRSVQMQATAVNNLHLAHTLLERGEVSRARRYVERAAELQPDPETLTQINRLADDIRTREGSS
jgi:tetratricopeptide (TPR) repeat protein